MVEALNSILGRRRGSGRLSFTRCRTVQAKRKKLWRRKGQRPVLAHPNRDASGHGVTDMCATWQLSVPTTGLTHALRPSPARLHLWMACPFAPTAPTAVGSARPTRIDHGAASVPGKMPARAGPVRPPRLQPSARIDGRPFKKPKRVRPRSVAVARVPEETDEGFELAQCRTDELQHGDNRQPGTDSDHSILNGSPAD